MEELIRHFETVQQQMQVIQLELVESQAKHEKEKKLFKQRLIKEFNLKLNKCKQDIKELKQENERLRVELEARAGIETGRGQVIKEQAVDAVESRRVVLETEVPVLGSDWPKVAWAKPSPKKKVLTYKGQPVTKLTSSQVNDLPTQYSSDVSPDSIERPKYLSLSPLKKKSKPNEEVEDSQDEFEPIDIPLNDISDQINNKPAQTKLQRKEFLRKYYTLKFHDSTFKIDLKTNPITENIWILEDFTQNSKYQKPVVNNKKLAIMTKQQQENYQVFNQLAGNSDLQSQELTYSQIFDKFPTPPGFLNSEFPDTQEQMRRRKIADERRDDRIQRRLASALMHHYNPGKQGEFIFVEPILNQYVDQGRFID